MSQATAPGQRPEHDRREHGLPSLIGRVVRSAIRIGINLLPKGSRKGQFSNRVLEFIETGVLALADEAEVRSVVRFIERDVLEVYTIDRWIRIVARGAELGGSPFSEEVRVDFQVESDRKTQIHPVQSVIKTTYSNLHLYFTFTSFVSLAKNLKDLADYVSRQR